MIRSTLALVFAAAFTSPAAAACSDLSKHPEISASGDLTRPMFAGPPNYEDVRKGDAPEPSYKALGPEWEKQLKQPILTCTN